MLVGETETHVDLGPVEGLGPLRMALEGQSAGWVLDEAYFDSQKLLLNGLEEAMASAEGRERVLALFAGTTQSEMDFGFGEADELGTQEAHIEEARLNPSQADALTMAAAADHCHLIQGPPGTGKTYVLARAVAALVERGERVLVSTFTHRAIHNALRACHKVIRSPDRIAKIGVQVFDTSLDPIRQYASWSKSPLRHQQVGGLVVGATPYTAFSQRLSGVQFDSVVMDEASQMTVPLAILAMLKGRKFLFFGDHCQLPPVLQSIPKQDAASWSVFGSLRRHTESTMLRTTYRLNAELAHWPSENFYHGELRSDETVAGRSLPCPNRAPTHPALSDAASVVFMEVAHEGSTTHCAEEADAVTDIVADALACGLPADEIGIVTPFRRQARQIKKVLRATSTLPEDAAENIVIDTVERFQGQERELVIVSLTTSDVAFFERIGAFYFQQERWNVAVTRARSKLVLLAGPELRRYDPVDGELAESVTLVKQLINGAAQVVMPG